MGGTNQTVPAARGFDFYYASPSGVEQHGLCFREKAPGASGDTDQYYTTHNYIVKKDVAICSDGINDLDPVNWWDFVTTRDAASNLLRTKSMSEILTDKTINYIDSIKTNGKPVFLYLNYTANHGPLDVDISDVPTPVDDGLGNTYTISYQQFKARVRTIYGENGQSSFSVGNYIYTVNPGDVFSWANASKRGRILSVEGMPGFQKVKYYLLGSEHWVELLG